MPKGQISPKYQAFADLVAADLAVGKPINGVALKYGIGEATIYGWKRDHTEFQSLIEQKRDAYRDKLVKEIEDSGQWTAKAWLLERLFRNQFAPPTQKIDQTVTRKVDELRDDELEAIASKALKTADSYNTPRRGKRAVKAA